MATVRRIDYDGSFYERDDPTGNVSQLLTKAQTAVTNNATFLGLASPTNAQTLAQVQALTRQVNALIKLQIGQFSDISGT